MIFESVYKSTCSNEFYTTIELTQFNEYAWNKMRKYLMSNPPKEGNFGEKGIEAVSLLSKLHSKVISDDCIKFDSLSESEIIDALKLLKGNKLVTRLEIKNCEISQNLMKMIDEMRVTTSIPIENVVFDHSRIHIGNPVILPDYILEAISDMAENNTILYDD